MTNGITSTFGAAEGNKQALVRGLKSAVGDADRLLSNAVALTADEITLARTKLEAQVISSAVKTTALLSRSASPAAPESLLIRRPKGRSNFR